MTVKKRKYLLLCLGLISISGCVENFAVGEENENLPPTTTLANIPIPGDTLYALTTLAWDGGDNDGFVVGYDYRYTTYPLGDSLGSILQTAWVRTEENTLKISFSSPDVINRQFFEVRAVDNSANVDSTPANIEFFTTQTRTPETAILSPPNNAQFFILEEPNVWIQGITFKFSGSDRDGTIIEYGWAVDGGALQWVDAKDTVVVVAPSEFAQPLTGEHTFRVISKDDTYLLDPLGASIRFDLVVPTFEKSIMILDDTREDWTLRDIDDATVDAFYEDIFGVASIDNRNLATRGFPDLFRLGSYQMVIYHADDTKGDSEYFNFIDSGSQGILASYLQVGGDLIVIGDVITYLSKLLTPPVPNVGYTRPIDVIEDNFLYTYMNIQVVNLSQFSPGTFEGAKGVNGFSDVALDTSKIPMVFPHFGLGIQVAGIVQMGGFTIPISTFIGNDPYASNLPVAVRYYGDVFDVAFVGFPMWTLVYEDAKTYAAELLLNMGY